MAAAVDGPAVLRRIRATQERRAKAYTEWALAFARAIAADAENSAADFQATAGVVTTELSAVSKELRELQVQCAENAAGDAALTLAHGLVDRLQAGERQRYEATVELQRLTAVHSRSPVAHDPGCAITRALRGSTGAAIVFGTGSAGLDASSSDDEGGDDVASAADENKPHRCHHGPDGRAGSRRGDGCSGYSSDYSRMQRAVEDATEAINEVLMELQCELSG